MRRDILIVIALFAQASIVLCQPRPILFPLPKTLQKRPSTAGQASAITYVNSSPPPPAAKKVTDSKIPAFPKTSKLDSAKALANNAVKGASAAVDKVVNKVKTQVNQKVSDLEALKQINEFNKRIEVTNAAMTAYENVAKLESLPKPVITKSYSTSKSEPVPDWTMPIIAKPVVQGSSAAFYTGVASYTDVYQGRKML